MTMYAFIILIYYAYPWPLSNSSCRYTLVPASVYLGFCASIIWVGEVHVTCQRFYSSFKLSLVTCIFTNCSLICQGTYLTSAARSHSTDNNLHEGAVIGDFNGEFWAVYALHQVIILFLTEDWSLCCFWNKILLQYEVDWEIPVFAVYWKSYYICSTEW